jgi:SAM-dependent methyltransferase
MDKCDILPNHTVLEIGFGPGYGLSMAAARAYNGTVYGLDFSEAMCKMASRRNRALVAASRVRLINGGLTPAPFENAFFDRTAAVNVAYFWPEPRRELSEILRILRPEGKAVFYLSDRHSMDLMPVTNTGVFAKYTAPEFCAVLSSAGFSRVEYETKTETLKEIRVSGHCFVAQK